MCRLPQISFYELNLGGKMKLAPASSAESDIDTVDSGVCILGHGHQ